MKSNIYIAFIAIVLTILFMSWWCGEVKVNRELKSNVQAVK